MSGDQLLTVALSRCRRPLFWIAGFSLVINILMLTSSLYMMQVYDRVIAFRQHRHSAVPYAGSGGGLGADVHAGLRPGADSRQDWASG